MRLFMRYYLLNFFMKTYVVGTCLNCLVEAVEAIQMSTHNVCFYKEVDKSALVVV